MSDVDINNLEVVHNESRNRFEVVIRGMTSVLDYRRSPGEISLVHTKVPPQLEGQGIAARLTETALNYARAHNLAVVPRCSYAAKFIERHPEYNDLVQRKQGAPG